MLALFLCGGLSVAASRAETSLSADQIIAKAVTHSQQGQNKASLPGYTYTKVTLMEEFDSTGNVKERKEKVFQVFFESGATR